jgi:hypothetical protein
MFREEKAKFFPLARIGKREDKKQDHIDAILIVLGYKVS